MQALYISAFIITPCQYARAYSAVRAVKGSAFGLAPWRAAHEEALNAREKALEREHGHDRP
jgi:hypothetical protein